MQVSMKDFTRMNEAVNYLYTTRLKALTEARGEFSGEERTIIAKAAQRVVYIVFNPDMDNDLAECSVEEEEELTNRFLDLDV